MRRYRRTPDLEICVTAPLAATAPRPAYRPYTVEVAEVRPISPNFVRISFTGTDLRDFGTAGLDQRIKVVFPLDDGSITDFGADDPHTIASGDWYARWRALPAELRNPFRTYTVRKVDAVRAIVDVDFFLHEPAGPAGTWAARASVGDQVVIVGPDEHSPGRRIGIDWNPGIATNLLIAADETAVPAALNILDSVPERSRVWAFLEVPSKADFATPSFRDGVRVSWVAREDGPHGESLLRRVGDWTYAHRDLVEDARSPQAQVVPDINVDEQILWDSPEAVTDGEFYAWLAGESSVIKRLRRLLVTENGIDRRRVAFMGYWRAGQAERQG